jgi:C-terminal processing protease CtpA/Prc
MKSKSSSHYFLIILALTGCRAAFAFAQQISGIDRDRARQMLADVSADIKKHYYDPKLHGVDWDAKVRETREKIDQSPSLNMAMSHLAAALDSLNDSHTFFLPPSRPFRIDFGYELEMIGAKCFIVRVRPKSDADAKGLKPGDEVLALNGYAPTRTTLWKMDYVYRHLRPQPEMKFTLRSPDGQQRQVVVTPRVQRLKRILNMTGSDGGSDIWDIVRQTENEEHFYRGRSKEVNDELMILKLPIFDFSDSEISSVVDKARKHKSLIIDLRGNGR